MFYLLNKLSRWGAKFLFKGPGEVRLRLYTHPVHHISNKNIFMNHYFLRLLQPDAANKFTNGLAGNTFNFIVELGFAHTHLY